MPKSCKKGAKIACIITGKTTYFNEAALQKKHKKYGTTEDFEKYFVCNQAKRLLKQKLTVDEVRKQLDCPDDLPKVDLEILAKLKLLKKKSKNLEAIEINEAFKTQSDTDKQKRIDEYNKDEKQYGDWGAYVRAFTSQPPGVGTCQRPDIYLNNDEHCADCTYFEFCLCRIWNGRKK